MARLGMTADRLPEKLKCQTFEWKTDLADIMSTDHHHLYLFVCSWWYLSNLKPNVPFESDVLFNQRFHRISSRLRLQLPGKPISFEHKGLLQILVADLLPFCTLTDVTLADRNILLVGGRTSCPNGVGGGSEGGNSGNGQKKSALWGGHP